MTRVAEITGLDRIGVPTFTCVRPGARRFSVSVTCGKGRRPIDAKVGAAMEAIEYYSAEPVDQLLVRARAGELEGAVLDPRELILPSWLEDAGTLALDWVPGWNLGRGEPIWIPANAVFFPYEPNGATFLFTSTTNGLAAGNRIEEAVCHGLAELIERDAWSLACARIWTGRADGHYPILDLDSVPPAAREIVERFRGAGLTLQVRLISSDTGIAAFHALCLESHHGDWLAHDGMGAHPDAEVALVRALTEAAQSRAGDIQGSREDLRFWRARAGSRIDEHPWLTPTAAGTTAFRNVATRLAADVLDDIRFMTERLRTCGLETVLAVDLTRPEIGLPVVRMIVPGLEVTCVDHWRVGARVRGQAAFDGVPVPLAVAAGLEAGRP